MADGGNAAVAIEVEPTLEDYATVFLGELEAAGWAVDFRTGKGMELLGVRKRFANGKPHRLMSFRLTFVERCATEEAAWHLWGKDGLRESYPSVADGVERFMQVVRAAR
ncbi:hypothetical protein NON20_23660 (plasmid) [Synechocystis sp. B12]|nr:hypothetical protein NON20_23660 [Synechocystis sp. B12]